MDQIFQTIGDSLGGFFKSDIVQFGLRAIGLYLVILWLASAYWAFRDMQQRSDNAILPYIAAAGIILFTPIFFIFAVWIYKIVRPHEKTFPKAKTDRLRLLRATRTNTSPVFGMPSRPSTRNSSGRSASRRRFGVRPRATSRRPPRLSGCRCTSSLAGSSVRTPIAGPW